MNWVVWLGVSSGLAVWFIFDSLQRRIDRFDSVYLKKWLMNKPDPIDAGLQDFHAKIITKWVIRFCIAAESSLYHWPSRCWGMFTHQAQTTDTQISHTHTHTHTQTYAYTCIYVYAHIHAYTCAYAHIHRCAQTHAHNDNSNNEIVFNTNR